MKHKLHNHILTEVKAGLDLKGLVIVDRCHTDMFMFYAGWDENHIIVSRNDFEKNHGHYKLLIADR